MTEIFLKCLTQYYKFLKIEHAAQKLAFLKMSESLLGMSVIMHRQCNAAKGLLCDVCDGLLFKSSAFYFLINVCPLISSFDVRLSPVTYC